MSSTTLTDLKQHISSKISITKSRGAPVKSKYQRLFYFGRELKTGSRSLDALLGNYKRFSTVMHLHSSQPKISLDSSGDFNANHELDVNIDGDGGEEDVIEVTQVTKPTTARTRPLVQEVISLDDSDDSDDDIEIIEGPSTKKARTI